MKPYSELGIPDVTNVVFDLGFLNWRWQDVDFSANIFYYLAEVQDFDCGGYTDEFVVTLTARGQSKFYRLRQHRAVFYASEPSQQRDTLHDLYPPRIMRQYCITDLPKWKKCDESWPLIGAECMIYVWHLDGAGKENAKRFRMEDFRNFLFWKEADGKDVLKIATRPMRYQSADDHFKIEQRKMKKKEPPSKPQ